MRNFATSLCLSAAWLAVLSLSGSAAQSPPVPDDSHISFTLPKDVKWVGDPAAGELHADLIGDPAKPGLYIRLAKWLPGHHSNPHFHDIERYFYVVSGTWWVSSSNISYDPSRMYPMTEGTFVTDHMNKGHFDGAMNEPGVILEIGIGPMKTVACKVPSDCP